jgi:tetratricopeptide (TPR) repeat protein
MLRTYSRNVEAEAALRAATRVDPTFAEAWYNLGDLLDEQGRSEAAIECLRQALQALLITQMQCSTRAAATTKKSVRGGCRSLAPLSRYGSPIGMGRTGAPILEIL